MPALNTVSRLLLPSADIAGTSWWGACSLDSCPWDGCCCSGGALEGTGDAQGGAMEG
jgi:hypothetical protein